MQFGTPGFQPLLTRCVSLRNIQFLLVAESDLLLMIFSVVFDVSFQEKEKNLPSALAPVSVNAATSQ